MSCAAKCCGTSLAALVLASTLWAGQVYPALQGQSVIPNQILVHYKSQIATSSVLATLVPGSQALPLPHIPDVYLVQLPAGTTASYLTQLSQHPLVDYVEPNRVRRSSLQPPNDSFLQSQWNLETIQAQQAWQLIPDVFLTSATANTGRIKVAVIDSGADCTHPDFANAGGSSQNVALGGQILFSSSQALVPTTIPGPACPWQDDFGHGTHVSGTVAAATNNAAGFAALGYPLALVEYKALDSTGMGTDAVLADAIVAAADAGANIISLSLGEVGYSQTLQNAVNHAWQKNSLVVAAAGNNGLSQLFFPGGANHVLDVAATDQNDFRAFFSNFGPSVGIAAPGVSIWSTLPTYLVPMTNQLSYGTLSGTSMATPQVAALAGLIEMATPNLSAMVVAQRIQQSADSTDPTAANGGWGQDQGYGRINAFRAISGNLRSASVGSLVGQVVDNSGAPIANAMVNVNGQSFTTDSTPTGLFRFSNLPAGATYTITTSAPSFPSVTQNAAVIAGADTNVTIVMGVITGQLTGIVSDSGIPLAGVGVEALSSGLIRAAAFTDATGVYSLPVPPGTYDLKASAMFSVTTTVASQTVSANASTAVNLTMARMGSISGTVVDATGHTFANAQITVANSSFSAGATTNSSGDFLTIGIPAGTYTVTATASGLSVAPVLGVVVINDQITVVSFSSRNVTVTTSPSSLSFTVDGTTFTAQRTFNWLAGSAHTLAVTSVQTGSGARYVFSGWAEQTVTTPSTLTTYTASFDTKYLLTLASTPSGSGSLAANPNSSDGYYASGALVQVTASPNTGYHFANFTGDLTGSTNPQLVAMTAPRSVTANFTVLTGVTVTTNPPGLTITVDSQSFTAPQTFSWTQGSSHILAVSSPQTGAPGTHYVWSNWNDGGAISHTITAPASGASVTYTANFTTQYLLTLAASPSAGGTLAANSSSADGYYNSGTSVQVTALANSGYQFVNFSGDLTGFANPQSVVMTAPRSVTANFSVTTTSVTVTTNQPGLIITVDSQFFVAPQTFSWTQGSSHILTVSSPQRGVPGTRYVWSNWSDGGAISHTITAPASGTSVTYTANFTTQYLLTLAASPSAGGTLAANSSSADGYYNSGTSVQVTALANSGYQFVNFSGDLTGFTNPQSVVMTAPRSVTANFSALTLAGAPAAYWKLDEPLGATSFADASGNGETGTCFGSSCPTMGVAGKGGTAASFNGTSNQITVPDSPALRVNQFTIALWVYPTQLKTNFQPLIVKEDSFGNNRNYGLFIAPNTMQIRYAAWGSDCVTRFAASSVGQLTLNAWNHIAFTYDGTVEKLYLNGALDSSNAASAASLCQAAVPVKLGMETSAFLPFNGTLDEAQIYSQALSAAGVLSLYNGL